MAHTNLSSDIHKSWMCVMHVLLTVNSLAPGGFENIFQNVFFKLISWIDTLSNSCETALRSMPQNPSDDKSTLVQVMAWCRQAASHYLSQCCPKSLSPYGVTRPQWVKLESLKNERAKFNKLLHASLIMNSIWNTGLILGVCPANERWRYFVTTSLIVWVHT